MAQPEQKAIVGVVICPSRQRVGDVLRVAMDADIDRTAARQAERGLPNGQQTADAGILQGKQMRPTEFGTDHLGGAFQKFIGLGRGKPVDRETRKAEPAEPGRGQQLIVEAGDPVGFEEAPGIDFRRTHQILRQIAPHLPQHPGQGRGARAVHAKNHNRGSGAVVVIGGVFLAGWHGGLSYGSWFWRSSASKRVRRS